ncbi:unnamed protein product [Amoebophrya sp. A120]|nr:unnamed protein product [Amoebophrya sp. A120]|eukprot:GSA120T00010469001.1
MAQELQLLHGPTSQRQKIGLMRCWRFFHVRRLLVGMLYSYILLGLRPCLSFGNTGEEQDNGFGSGNDPNARPSEPGGNRNQGASLTPIASPQDVGHLPPAVSDSNGSPNYDGSLDRNPAAVVPRLLPGLELSRTLPGFPSPPLSYGFSASARTAPPSSSTGGAQQNTNSNKMEMEATVIARNENSFSRSRARNRRNNERIISRTSDADNHAQLEGDNAAGSSFAAAPARGRGGEALADSFYSILFFTSSNMHVDDDDNYVVQDGRDGASDEIRPQQQQTTETGLHGTESDIAAGSTTPHGIAHVRTNYRPSSQHRLALPLETPRDFSADVENGSMKPVRVISHADLNLDGLPDVLVIWNKSEPRSSNSAHQESSSGASPARSSSVSSTAPSQSSSFLTQVYLRQKPPISRASAEPQNYGYAASYERSSTRDYEKTLDEIASDSEPFLVDLNFDGRLDLLLADRVRISDLRSGTSTGPDHRSTAATAVRLILFPADQEFPLGKFLLQTGWKAQTDGVVFSVRKHFSPSLADLDGDNTPELIVPVDITSRQQGTQKIEGRGAHGEMKPNSAAVVQLWVFVSTPILGAAPDGAGNESATSVAPAGVEQRTRFVWLRKKEWGYDSIAPARELRETEITSAEDANSQFSFADLFGTGKTQLVCLSTSTSGTRRAKMPRNSQQAATQEDLVGSAGEDHEAETPAALMDAPLPEIVDREPALIVEEFTCTAGGHHHHGQSNQIERDRGNVLQNQNNDVLAEASEQHPEGDGEASVRVPPAQHSELQERSGRNPCWRRIPISVHAREDERQHGKRRQNVAASGRRSVEYGLLSNDRWLRLGDLNQDGKLDIMYTYCSMTSTGDAHSENTSARNKPGAQDSFQCTTFLLIGNEEEQSEQPAESDTTEGSGRSSSSYAQHQNVLHRKVFQKFSLPKGDYSGAAFYGDLGRRVQILAWAFELTPRNDATGTTLRTAAAVGMYKYFVFCYNPAKISFHIQTQALLSVPEPSDQQMVVHPGPTARPGAAAGATSSIYTTRNIVPFTCTLQLGYLNPRNLERKQTRTTLLGTSNHFGSLQLPFLDLGLKDSNSYIDDFEIGCLPFLPNARGFTRRFEGSQIVPNSAVAVIIPFSSSAVVSDQDHGTPALEQTTSREMRLSHSAASSATRPKGAGAIPDSPRYDRRPRPVSVWSAAASNEWSLELVVNPAGYFYVIFFVCLLLLVVLLLVAFVLHERERKAKQADREKQFRMHFINS